LRRTPCALPAKKNRLALPVILSYWRPSSDAISRTAAPLANPLEPPLPSRTAAPRTHSPPTSVRSPRYLASFSSRTIVYKGMVQSSVLARFYKDLSNDKFETNFIIYHRRFSTNTSPR
jgi:hypothetical protein